MTPQLLLTAEEQNGLSESVRKFAQDSGVVLATETLQSFETPEQTRYRFDHCTLGTSSGFEAVRQQCARSMTKPESLQTIDFSALSPEELQKFFSMIGAVGVSAFIELGLKTCAESDDLRAIADLTHVRHGLLLSNQEFFLRVEDPR